MESFQPDDRTISHHQGLRQLWDNHYESLCRRFEIQRLHPNGAWYVYEMNDESGGLETLGGYGTCRAAARAVRDLVAYLDR